MIEKLEQLVKKAEELQLTSEALAKKVEELDDAALALEPKQTEELGRITYLNHSLIVKAVEDICNKWRRAALVCGALLLITWFGIILSALL